MRKKRCRVWVWARRWRLLSHLSNQCSDPGLTLRSQVGANVSTWSEVWFAPGLVNIVQLSSRKGGTKKRRQAALCLAHSITRTTLWTFRSWLRGQLFTTYAVQTLDGRTNRAHDEASSIERDVFVRWPQDTVSLLALALHCSGLLKPKEARTPIWCSIIIIKKA